MRIKKPKVSVRAPVGDASIPELERDLVRAKNALGNKKLLPQSIKFYTRRQEMIESEMERRRVTSTG
jgi:hypothetical protein